MQLLCQTSHSPPCQMSSSQGAFCLAAPDTRATSSRSAAALLPPCSPAHCGEKLIRHLQQIHLYATWRRKSFVGNDDTWTSCQTGHVALSDMARANTSSLGSRCFRVCAADVDWCFEFFQLTQMGSMLPP